MNDDIKLCGVNLAALLDQLGLPQVSRDRLIAIDRQLADELDSGNPDADGCANLVLEAADRTSDPDPAGFDGKEWDDDDYPASDDGLVFDTIERGKK